MCKELPVCFQLVMMFSVPPFTDYIETDDHLYLSACPPYTSAAAEQLIADIT